MPWKSEAQRRWGNSPAGHKALGDAGVSEWNAASKGMKLPKHKAFGGGLYAEGGPTPTLNYPAMQSGSAPAVNYFGEHPYGMHGKHGLDLSIPLGSNTDMTGRASLAPNAYGPDRHDYGMRFGIRQRFAEGGSAYGEPPLSHYWDQLRRMEQEIINHQRFKQAGREAQSNAFYGEIDPEIMMRAKGLNPSRGQGDAEFMRPTSRNGEFLTSRNPFPPMPQEFMPETNYFLPNDKINPANPYGLMRQEGGAVEPFGGELYDRNAPEPAPETYEPWRKLGEAFSARPEDYGGKTSNIYKLLGHLYGGLEESAKGTMEASEGLRQTGEYNAKEPFMAALNLAGSGTPFAMRGAAGTFGGKLFSPLERAVEEGPKRGTSAEWLGFLQNRPGVKKSELADIGLENFLAEKGRVNEPSFTGRFGMMGHNNPPPGPPPPISKDDLLNHIRNNRLEYSESLMQEAPDAAFNRKMMDKYGSYRHDKWTPEEKEEYARLQRAQADLPRDQRKAPTRYEGYQLAGGDNYRERVVSLSPKELPDKTIEDYAKHLADEYSYGRSWKDMDDAEKKEYLRMAKDNLSKIESHDFSVPTKHYNFHVRENDRVIDGKKTLNIEELQSDLYQRLRDQGGFDPVKMINAEKAYKSVAKEHENVDREFRKNLRDALRSDQGRTMPQETRNALFDAPYQIATREGEGALAHTLENLPEANKEEFLKLRELYQRKIAAHKEYTEASENVGTPNMPMSNTSQWGGVAMKRMLREAADKGYEQISWVPGVEQTQRYWGPEATRTQHGLTYNKQANVLYGYGKKDEYGNQKMNLSKKYITPEKLEGIVGKETAEKLLAEKGSGNGYSKPTVQLDQPLDIARHGMEGFYDKVLVNLMNDYGKKYGAKVVKKEIDVPTTRREVTRENPNWRDYQVDDYLRDNPTRKAPIFVMEIPEKMRAAIMSGKDAKLSGMYKAGGAVIKRAAGGPIPPTPNIVKGGLLHSDVPGRTDDLSINVPSGAYVIPADIVAGEGQGNTIAGSKKIHSMFSGPMGLPVMKKKARQGKIGMGHAQRLRAGHLPRGSRIRALESPFADGGAPEMPPEASEGEETPILAAGGEYIVHPHMVRKIGRGDLKEGHRVLDAFVLHARKQHIKQIKNLKPPVKT